jgi:hypothetical protein
LRKGLADAVTQQLRARLLSCDIQPHTFPLEILVRGHDGRYHGGSATDERA